MRCGESYSGIYAHCDSQRVVLDQTVYAEEPPPPEPVAELGADLPVRVL